MNLTKKGEYALRTLIQLGIAKQQGREVVSVAALSLSEKLPYKFIENILQELRRAGYVQSKRGKEGGCQLAKPMESIPIGEVVRLIDGRLAPIGCASETDYARCTCPDEEHCGLRMIMIDVRNAIANILDRYTLADLVRVTLQKMDLNGVERPYAKPKVGAAVPETGLAAPVSHANPLDGFLSLLHSSKQLSANLKTS